MSNYFYDQSVTYLAKLIKWFAEIYVAYVLSITSDKPITVLFFLQAFTQLLYQLLLISTLYPLDG